MLRQAATMGRAYDRVRAKMQEKYGKYSHTVDWKNNKSKPSLYAGRA